MNKLWHWSWTKPNSRLPMHHICMFLLAFAIGIIAGFGAVAFRFLIGIIHNVMFNWHWSFLYDATIPTKPSFWGWAVIFVPVYGAIVVTFLVNTFAPEAKGHGVPEVMYAIYYQKAKIRPIVGLIKAVASAISIGTGGSIGREGPIIQIGATFGSVLGRIPRISDAERIILLAAGAAGGIAATFNAPLGGVAFAAELMLVSINAESLFPVAIATVVATFIGNIYFGNHPEFIIPIVSFPHLSSLMSMPYLLWFIPFGLLIGLLSIVLTKGIYIFEDFCNAKIKNSYIRHMLGMLIVGGMMELFMVGSGYYFIEGVGYAPIVATLRGTITNVLMLILLSVAKWFATCLTLGSGASGGVFSPSLYIGATFGTACGICLNYLMPGLHINPVIFGIAGMAGMISGATSAVFTGIIMVGEMTDDHRIMLPLIITAALAYVVRRCLCPSSIYTMKLNRRKQSVPQGLNAAYIEARVLAGCCNKDFSTSDSATAIKKTTLVHNSNSIQYIKIPHSSKEYKFHIMQAKESLADAINAMRDKVVDYILVQKPDAKSSNAQSILGFISKDEIFDICQQQQNLQKNQNNV